MLRACPLVIAIVLACAGCVRLPRYDGGVLLAHPTMTTEEIRPELDRHVRAVSEGARGGVGGGVIDCAR